MDVTKRMLAMMQAGRARPGAARASRPRRPRGPRAVAPRHCGTAGVVAAVLLALGLAVLPVAGAAQEAPATAQAGAGASAEASAETGAQAGGATAAAAPPAPLPAAPAEPGAAGGPPGPQETAATGPVLGPETNLPLPRFVSLKAGESNVRRGPSLTHRIDWVFLRRDMPLRIVAEYGHWRRVVDREGLGGWMHYSLLSGTRTVIVDRDMMPLLSRPDPNAPEIARLENGVIARLGDCRPDWCQLAAGGYRGWARKDGLWGVEPDELRD